MLGLDICSKAEIPQGTVFNFSSRIAPLTLGGLQLLMRSCNVIYFYYADI